MTTVGRLPSHPSPHSLSRVRRDKQLPPRGGSSPLLLLPTKRRGVWPATPAAYLFKLSASFALLSFFSESRLLRTDFSYFSQFRCSGSAWQAAAKARKRRQTSYRTRRSRDQVSSNLLFFLISPPQADFAPSGMTDPILVLETLSLQQPASNQLTCES